MSSPFLRLRRSLISAVLGGAALAGALVLTSGTPALAAAPAPGLRICADPDNLPFSNRQARGFDNRIAALIAQDLGRKPVFVWARSRRGFLREQFNKDACDVLTGVPVGMHTVATTEPYYRSSYVFVTRSREGEIGSFADPRLNGRRIGLQILEENLSPPSLPLIRSGHGGQLVGFESFGNEAGDIVRAVSDGRVGLAVVWGPLAGFFAAREHLAVRLTAPRGPPEIPGVPMSYALALGVHKRDIALRDALSASIRKHQAEISRVLAAYHVPTVTTTEGTL